MHIQPMNEYRGNPQPAVQGRGALLVVSVFE